MKVLTAILLLTSGLTAVLAADPGLIIAVRTDHGVERDTLSYTWLKYSVEEPELPMRTAIVAETEMEHPRSICCRAATVATKQNSNYILFVRDTTYPRVDRIAHELKAIHERTGGTNVVWGAITEGGLEEELPQVSYPHDAAFVVSLDVAIRVAKSRYISPVSYTPLGAYVLLSMGGTGDLNIINDPRLAQTECTDDILALQLADGEMVKELYARSITTGVPDCPDGSSFNYNHTLELREGGATPAQGVTGLGPAPDTKRTIEVRQPLSGQGPDDSVEGVQVDGATGGSTGGSTGGGGTGGGGTGGAQGSRNSGHGGSGSGSSEAAMAGLATGAGAVAGAAAGAATAAAAAAGPGAGVV